MSVRINSKLNTHFVHRSLGVGETLKTSKGTAEIMLFPKKLRKDSHYKFVF